jgi:hypothetical protein
MHGLSFLCVKQKKKRNKRVPLRPGVPWRSLIMAANIHSVNNMHDAPFIFLHHENIIGNVARVFCGEVSQVVFDSKFLKSFALVAGTGGPWKLHNRCLKLVNLPRIGLKLD